MSLRKLYQAKLMAPQKAKLARVVQAIDKSMRSHCHIGYARRVTQNAPVAHTHTPCNTKWLLQIVTLSQKKGYVLKT